MITRNQADLHGNWKKELAEVVTDPAELMRLLDIPVEIAEKHFPARRLFPVRVPRPFISKMIKGDISDPLLRQVMPLEDEFIDVDGFTTDPLEEQTPVAPGLLHKYESRVLFILKGGCAVNCRYCFRRHFPYSEHSLNKAELLKSISYIRADERINEVILSGGDPLMANDDALEWLLSELEQIPHLTRLRIHSRLPVVLPNRITDAFCAMLQTSRLNCVLVTHINHGNEIDAVFKSKIDQLKRADVTVLNQAVLLKTVNDSCDVLTELSEKLFAAGILPYYLFLLDKVKGAAHFEVAEQEATSIMSELLARLPGFLVPKLAREEPHQKSKTPIDLHLLES